MERLIVVGVPIGSYDGESAIGKSLATEARSRVTKALTGQNIIFQNDSVQIVFKEEKDVSPDSLLRPLKIITIYGEGVEPDEIKATIEIKPCSRYS